MKKPSLGHCAPPCPPGAEIAACNGLLQAPSLSSSSSSTSISQATGAENGPCQQAATHRAGPPMLLLEPDHPADKGAHSASASSSGPPASKAQSHPRSEAWTSQSLSQLQSFWGDRQDCTPMLPSLTIKQRTQPGVW